MIFGSPYCLNEVMKSALLQSLRPENYFYLISFAMYLVNRMMTFIKGDIDVTPPPQNMWVPGGCAFVTCQD